MLFYCSTSFSYKFAKLHREILVPTDSCVETQNFVDTIRQSKQSLYISVAKSWKSINNSLK